MTTTWTDADLARFGDAEEVRIAGIAPATARLRKPVIVWVVRVGDELYTRSVNGPDAAWFRGIQVRDRGQLSADGKEIDVDCRWTKPSRRRQAKSTPPTSASTGRYAGPVRSITSPTARSTTLKLVPHQPD